MPRGSGSEAKDAFELAAGYGLTLDDWQQDVLRAWLGLRRDGKWASPRCGLAVARQNGKNGVLEVRELYGLVFRGERFLHTAHEVKTARKAFLRLLHFFDNPRQFPELHALTKEVRRTNGQEAIVLNNGGSVEFIARSKGSGRGFTVDVLVMDEAQELSDDTLAALLPTISAAPLGAPQTIYTGTPPSESMNGEVFTRMRRAGMTKADRRLCWIEWSCLPGADVDDRANWTAANPALGDRLGWETIEDERAAMDVETFARERLGTWDEDGANDALIPFGVWQRQADAESSATGAVSLALEVAQDYSWACIGAAGARADGSLHVQVAENHRGTAWIVEKAVELAAQHGGAIALSPKSPAGVFAAALEAAGLKVIPVAPGAYAQACGLFLDGVTQGTVFHLSQPELDASIRGVRQRIAGEAWVFDRRRPSIDISPLVAVTLAAWSHLTSAGIVRNAGRGRVIALS